MEDYRSLTEEEISILEDHGCTAEDWTAINVAEDFMPAYIHEVAFYGNICMGVFDKSMEIDEGFTKHAGIRNAVLRDVTIGDNCIIENIGNYIYNYDIGEECYISNVGRMNTTPGATYAEGNVISVMNEAGNGNIILYDGLTSQLAAFMVSRESDKALKASLHKMIEAHAETLKPTRGTIGFRVKITNTTEITNTKINDDCEISGASRLNECSIMSIPEASIFIGNDVICEYSIVGAGSSILDGAKVSNCFVGESCHIGKGFSAESCVFFANSYMDNGEACASFCGPFTVSHHKSTLLIGGDFSFYNAGSNTNYSNHAYKMGPIHFGTLERGCKTASGAHLLMPASIGAFSMCMGKIQSHPDTRALPFSYLIAQGDATFLVPGRNLMTVGTYRDVNKWRKRDMRPRSGRRSIVCFDWLNPHVMLEVIRGKKLLENLRAEQGGDVASYVYNGCTIKNTALQRGIKYYDMAIRIYAGEQLRIHDIDLPANSIGTGEWCDMAGLVAPESEIIQLADDIKGGMIEDVDDIDARFSSMFRNYEEYKWAWTYRLITDFYKVDVISEEDTRSINEEYGTARMEWLNAIRHDAEKEFEMGDVDEDTLNKFLDSMAK